jgi:hypothetical protein
MSSSSEQDSEQGSEQDLFISDKAMQNLYITDKAAFYRLKNKPLFDEMLSKIESLKEDKAKLFQGWMDLQLMDDDSVEDYLRFRTVGRAHDAISDQLEKAFLQFQRAIRLEPSKIQDDFAESVTEFYIAEKLIYREFKEKLAEKKSKDQEF